MTDITLSEEQTKGLAEVLKWYKSWSVGGNSPFFYLAGYAGTGKTTITKVLAEELRSLYNSMRILHAAYTGKAALRMHQTGSYGAQTIHSLIYTPIDDEDQKTVDVEAQFELNLKSELTRADLLILDECSMVSEQIGADLLSFDKPILVLGDPGQLPPVKGTGFFTARKPNYTLKEVHRQALDSSIIRVATYIRQGKTLARMNEPDAVIYPFSKDYNRDELIKTCDQILTGKNATRGWINNYARKMHGLDETKMPMLGDKLICLRNNKNQGLFNGLIGNVTKVTESCTSRVLLDMDTDIGPMKDIEIHPECFYDTSILDTLTWRERSELNEFDYGYAITVHKSQGSQWDDVLVVDDKFLSWDKEARKRWLYTAVTRAAKKITVVNAK